MFAYKHNKQLIGKSQYVIPNGKEFKHKLDVMENTLPYNPYLISSFGRYPDQGSNHAELMTHISNYTGVNTSNITLTPGSDTALEKIIQCFVTESSVVLIFTPTYPHFESFISLTKTKEVRELEADTASVILDYDYTGVDFVYIVSPNMPLGYSLTKSETEMLLTKNPNTLFVIDHAYVEYSDGEVACDKLINEHSNLIITRTFSKAFGLAGLRIGYVLANEQITNFISPAINTKAVTSYAIDIANMSMRDLSLVTSNVQEVQAYKHKLRQELNQIIFKDAMIYDYILNDGCYYTLKARDPVKVCKIFEAHQILVRDKSSSMKDCIRLSLFNQDVNKDVIEVIKFINMKQLLQKYPVVFDLDGTLRKGVGEYFSSAEDKVSNSHPDTIVLTNNSFVTGSELFTRKLIRSRDYLPDNVRSLTTNNMSIKDIVDLIKCGEPVYYTDSSKSTKLNCSVEFYEDSETEIPDTGLIVDVLKSFGVQTVSCCKQDVFVPTVNYSYVVGDSESDSSLSKRLNSRFVKVGAETNQFNFDTNTFEFVSLDHI